MDHGKVMMHAPVQEVFAHTRKLCDMGLDIPQITKVFLALKEKGYPVRTDIYTVEGAGREICRVLKEGGAR